MSKSSMDWTAKPPATEAEINRLVASAPFAIPKEYLDLLRRFNGGEGELALPPLWLQLWSTDEVIAFRSSDLSSEFPGFLFFASNGGLESIALRQSTMGTIEVVMLDAIAGSDSVETIAKNFSEFVLAIGKTCEA